jgi:hypothetical protein
VGAVYIIRDETEKRRLEREREVLIVKLQKALDEVKTLRGLIPICSVCKKVRDDEGYWKEVEEYVGSHTTPPLPTACPDCLRRIYPSWWTKYWARPGRSNSADFFSLPSFILDCKRIFSILYLRGR